MHPKYKEHVGMFLLIDVNCTLKWRILHKIFRTLSFRTETVSQAAKEEYSESEINKIRRWHSGR